MSTSSWTKIFIGDLHVVQIIKNVIEMLWDKIGVNAITKGPMVTNKTKHLQWKFICICWDMELGNIHIKNVYIDNNLAYPFMNSLSKNKFESHVKGMGL